MSIWPFTGMAETRGTRQMGGNGAGSWWGIRAFVAIFACVTTLACARPPAPADQTSVPNLSISQAESQHGVAVHLGEVVRFTLSGSFSSSRSSDEKVLRPTSPPMVRDGRTVMDFRAVGSGAAVFESGPSDCTGIHCGSSEARGTLVYIMVTSLARAYSRVLTQADSNAVVATRLGEQIAVILPVASGTDMWTDAHPDSFSALATIAGPAATDKLRWVGFRLQEPGQTGISASAGNGCIPTPTCAVAVTFHVTLAAAMSTSGPALQLRTTDPPVDRVEISVGESIVVQDESPAASSWVFWSTDSAILRRSSTASGTATFYGAAPGYSTIFGVADPACMDAHALCQPRYEATVFVSQ